MKFGKVRGAFVCHIRHRDTLSNRGTHQKIFANIMSGKIWSRSSSRPEFEFRRSLVRKSETIFSRVQESQWVVLVCLKIG